MPVRKRKRKWWTELASFPDERCVEEGNKSAEAAMTAASVSGAWLRCGDGFKTASSVEMERSSEKRTGVKKCIASFISSIEGKSKSESTSEFTDIVWSSSGSDISDDENKTSELPHLKKEKYRKYDLIFKDGYNEGEPQFIDWEDDSNYEDDVEQCNGSKTEVPLEISDNDSCRSSRFMSDEEKEDEPSKAIPIHISEYSSDSENLEECPVKTEAGNLKFSKKFQFSLGARNETDAGKLVSDWLKSAQTLLQTPRKKAYKSLRSPEDSAKKRKWLRGGLAERLNRLQNRERTAISFWRQQCISDYKSFSGVKSGVLIVKILEMHEECTHCIAVCHQLQPVCAASSSTEEILNIQSRLKVLFAKETASLLKAVPQDVIYIHPPWQKLFLLNEKNPVILNTYFSQKVVAKEPTEKERPDFQEPLFTKRSISLAWIFHLSAIKDSSPQVSAINQTSCPDMKTSKTVYTHTNQESKLSPFAVSSLSESLLDIVEAQGTAEGRAIQVQVVVQRVYYLIAKDLRCHLQEDNLSQNTSPLLNSDQPNIRLCFLVQDTYGIFGEIQFQVLLSSSEPIEKYIKKWEGKHCRLPGMKILRRITRGRALGLFSLVDSLWPPVLPVKVPGQSQENEMQVTDHLPPPSFCYILAAHSDQRLTDVDEEEPISDLYFPPAVYNLKEIIQMCNLHWCCSFWAYVVYQRLQETGTTLSSQRQFCLFVTDFSLQSWVEGNPETPKTLPVLVTSSLVIDVEVMEALKSTSPCVIFFKDALCGNGRIICIERTVLSLQKPLLCRAASTDITELTGPVQLDKLDSATQVNSICTVKGTIAGINERTAFSCPTCNRCGSGKIKWHPQNRELLYCCQCCEAIISPVLNNHLEIFLHCQSLPLSTVKVKLLQRTFSSLLESSPTDHGSYGVKSLLGQEVGTLYCYVQSVVRYPASCVGLEEIVLPDTGKTKGMLSASLKYS
ncbi:DNA repair-scaffolding protein isoform X1 [Varanus komodoensis]|uniref:Scaffold protein involved in DNA repair n=1 Tax=Varanus komodoensis TaxID=61221 RepID=A0A8D2JHC7_VARKO|nr:DNA repair-scaffolding protein isoform X1 [Varanus komodoensis]